MFLNQYTKNKKGYLSLYGNDAEIFNFRPSRFKEKKLVGGEWKKIENILNKINKKIKL